MNVDKDNPINIEQTNLNIEKLKNKRRHIKDKYMQDVDNKEQQQIEFMKYCNDKINCNKQD